MTPMAKTKKPEATPDNVMARHMANTLLNVDADTALSWTIAQAGAGIIFALIAIAKVIWAKK